MTDAAKRRGSRVRTVLPVRVFGLDSSGKPFTDVAHTLDISKSGVRLGGLKYSLAVGDVVGVQRGIDKTRFRVAWVGSPNTRCEHQAGLCSIQPERCIWPAELLAEQKPDDYSPPSIPADGPVLAVASRSSERDRRTADRLTCNLGAELEAEGSGVKLWARCTDLSMGGCYMELRAPFPLGTVLRVRLSNKTMTFNAWGVVRVSHPYFGMGVQFANLDPSTQMVLEMLLQTLTEEAIAPDAPRPQPLFDLRARTLAFADELRVLETDLAAGGQTSEIARTLRDAISSMRQTLDVLQELMTSSVRNDPAGVSERLLLQRIRAATYINRELCSALGPETSISGMESCELLQVSKTLVSRLMSDCGKQTEGASNSDFDTNHTMTVANPSAAEQRTV